MVDFADYRQSEQFLWVPRDGDALTDASDIVGKAKVLYSLLDFERSRLGNIDLWYKGSQEIPHVRHADAEMQRLLELARTPWLSLVVNSIAQALFVDGFQSPRTGGPVASVWDLWLRNRMSSHQGAIHRAALGYGYAFAVATKTESGVQMHGLSPKRCFAVYRDPAVDEWPEYAIRVDRLSGDNDALVFLYDNRFVHQLRLKDGKWTLLSTDPHGAVHAPIVRYTNMLDLDGATPGEVEPFIGVAARIDKTMFDRLLVQHYNSWKKIYVAGLKKPEGLSEAEAEFKKMKLRQQDMIMLEDVDSKIGALAETSLDGFLGAIEADIEEIAILSQLNHLLTGKLANLSADTLVAANRPLTQKVFERQVSFGQSHNQLLRLAAELDGQSDVVDDFGAHVTWQDTEVRSLAQAADALGKMVQVLGIPKRAAWRMIPDITEQQAQEWEKMLLSDDPVERFIASQQPVSGQSLSKVDDGE